MNCGFQKLHSPYNTNIPTAAPHEHAEMPTAVSDLPHVCFGQMESKETTLLVLASVSLRVCCSSFAGGNSGTFNSSKCSAEAIVRVPLTRANVRATRHIFALQSPFIKRSEKVLFGHCVCSGFTKRKKRLKHRGGKLEQVRIWCWFWQRVTIRKWRFWRFLLLGFTCWRVAFSLGGAGHAL